MSSKCNWRLDAISNAAKTRRKISFVLKAGENKVGKKKDCLLKIPSVLCSREHCSIFLDDDKVTIEDKSRNGTYITFSGDIGTKHYLNGKTENPLEPNDIISFGFNMASVYDVNDKNAFIYRLIKEDIETIDLDDSDDEAAETPEPSKVKIIEIDNKIIDIPSDSDSEYSGSECLQNIEEMEESSIPTPEGSDDFDDEESSNESIDSDESDEDESFIVTKTILKCNTPTETIALDEDSSSSEREAEAHPSDEQTTGHLEMNEVDGEGDGNAKESNGIAIEEPSTSEAADTSESTTNAKQNSKDGEEEEEDSTVVSSTKPNDEPKLGNLKRRLAEMKTKKVIITKPQPLKRRRQTITELEYNQQKQERKRLIKEKIAKLGDRDRKAREAAAENAGELNRVAVVPKVKNAPSRGEQLLTDMLADDTSDT